MTTQQQELTMDTQTQMFGNATIGSHDGLTVYASWRPSPRHSVRKIAWLFEELSLSACIGRIEQAAWYEGCAVVTIQADKWPAGTFAEGHIIDRIVGSFAPGEARQTNAAGDLPDGAAGDLPEPRES